MKILMLNIDSTKIDILKNMNYQLRSGTPDARETPKKYARYSVRKTNAGDPYDNAYYEAAW